jgi:hypothetical protein
MSTMPSPAAVASGGNYAATRFNALQHGVLSCHAVLPWEDPSEYEALLTALVAEHAPQGPTEEHLVEELAGIIWRKRRLRLAEAAVFPVRDGLEYEPTAEALKAWLDHHWEEWFEQPIAELEHRDAIREQAFGAAYATHNLETPARYEVHLDRKLERTLAMLIRLRDL